jgi:transposase-like protein
MGRIRGPPLGAQADQGSPPAFPDSITNGQFLCKYPLDNSERSLYIYPMPTDTKLAPMMTCEGCSVACQRFGKHRNGLLRFRCPNCKKTYTEAHERTLGSMYIPQDRAVLALRLLLEGNSLRSTQRITGTDINTIMTLLVKAGEKCQKLMYEKMLTRPIFCTKWSVSVTPC